MKSKKRRVDQRSTNVDDPDDPLNLTSTMPLNLTLALTTSNKSSKKESKAQLFLRQLIIKHASLFYPFSDLMKFPSFPFALFL